jgi:hypothetical protein
MKTLKYLISVIIFLFANTAFVFSDITASAPTNLIATIAAASSFSTINENTAESGEQVQNITSEVINTEQVLEAVQEGAEIFGQQNDDEALAAFASEDTDTLAMIGGEENVFASRRDLEPNLDTIVYDTGMMNLTNEALSGSDIADNYNNDSDNRIFDDTPGAQQARVLIYVDFKRNVLFGEIQSKVTLLNKNDGLPMSTIAKGGAKDLSDLDLSEPIDGELTKTLVTSGANTGTLGVGDPLDGGDEPFAWAAKHSITSLVKENGNQPLFFGGEAPGERILAQTEYSHLNVDSTDAKGNVQIGARFFTPGEGTLGTSTASFEASHGAHNASATDYTEGVVRYSATATTTATNIKD